MAKRDLHYTGCVDCDDRQKNVPPAKADKFVADHKAKGHKAYGAPQLNQPKKR